MLSPLRSLLRIAAHESGAASILLGVALSGTAVAGSGLVGVMVLVQQDGAEQLEATTQEAFARLAEVLVAAGAVTVATHGGNSIEPGVATISVVVALAPGGEQADLADVVLIYSDDAMRGDVPATVRWLRGEGPVLQAGELAELTITVPAGAELQAGDSFTLEFAGAAGSLPLVSRQLPPYVQRLTYLP
jgi:archaellin